MRLPEIDGHPAPYQPLNSTGDDLREQYEKLSAIAKHKRCRVCNAPIQVGLRYIREEHRQEHVLTCGCRPDPPQLQHVESTYEAYKRGADVPLHTANVIERKLDRRHRLSTAIVKREDVQQHLATFGDVGQDQVTKAFALVQRYGFNPYVHLTMYQKRVTTTIDGIYWWVRNHSPQQFDVVNEVIPTDQKDAYGIASHEIGVIAKVYRRGENRPACTGFGRASTDHLQPVMKGQPIESQHTFRMAEKRAEAQALRKFFAIGDVLLPGDLKDTAPWQAEDVSLPLVTTASEVEDQPSILPVDEDGVIQEAATSGEAEGIPGVVPDPALFENKGQVHEWYRQHYDLGINEIRTHYPEGKNLQDLSVADLVNAAEMTVAARG